MANTCPKLPLLQSGSRSTSTPKLGVSREYDYRDKTLRKMGGRRQKEDSAQPFSLSQFYQTPFDIAYERVSKQRALRRLEQLFRECDKDGSGSISLEEFQQSLNHIPITKAFAQLGVQPHQSAVIFKSICKTKSGELTINAFIRGLTEIVDLDAGQELNVDSLKARNRRRTLSQNRTNTELSPEKVEMQRKLSSMAYHNEFMFMASCQALYPATATWRGRSCSS